MNIIDNRGNNLVTFSEIKVGDCFDRNGHIYLKTNIFCDWDDGTNYNAINLNSNCFDFFYDKVNVLKVNATISIEYNMEEQ